MIEETNRNLKKTWKKQRWKRGPFLPPSSRLQGLRHSICLSPTPFLYAYNLQYTIIIFIILIYGTCNFTMYFFSTLKLLAKKKKKNHIDYYDTISLSWYWQFNSLAKEQMLFAEVSYIKRKEWIHSRTEKVKFLTINWWFKLFQETKF